LKTNIVFLLRTLDENGNLDVERGICFKPESPLWNVSQPQQDYYRSEEQYGSQIGHYYHTPPTQTSLTSGLDTEQRGEMEKLQEMNRNEEENLKTPDSHYIKPVPPRLTDVGKASKEGAREKKVKRIIRKTVKKPDTALEGKEDIKPQAMSGKDKSVFTLIGIVYIVQILALLLIHADLEGSRIIDPQCICFLILFSILFLFVGIIIAAIYVNKSRWGIRGLIALILIFTFDIIMIIGFVREIFLPLIPALYMVLTIIGFFILANIPVERAARSEFGRVIGIAMFVATLIANMVGILDIVYPLIFLLIGFTFWYSGQEIQPVHREDHLSSLSSGIIVGIVGAHWIVFQYDTSSVLMSILVILGTSAGSSLLLIGWKYGWKHTSQGWMSGGLSGFGMCFLLGGVILLLQSSISNGTGLSIIGSGLILGGIYMNRKNDKWGWGSFAIGLNLILLVMALIGNEIILI